MIQNDIQIVNRALSLIGVPAISELNAENKTSYTCKSMLPVTKAAVFRAYAWNCLTRRAILPKSSESPKFEFANKFVLPADCIRVLSIESPNFYQIEGNFLLSDEGIMNIIYTSDGNVLNDYDPLLIDALSARLASDLCQPLLNTITVTVDLWKIYQLKLKEARWRDMQENKFKYGNANRWIGAR